MTKLDKEIAQIDRSIENLKFDLARPHLVESARGQIKALQAIRAELVAKQVAKLVR